MEEIVFVSKTANGKPVKIYKHDDLKDAMNTSSETIYPDKLHDLPDILASRGDNKVIFTKDDQGLGVHAEVEVEVDGVRVASCLSLL